MRNELWKFIFVLALLVSLFAFKGLILTYICKLPHFCLFEGLANINCPGCGTLMSIVYLSKFDFRNSINENPSGLMVLFYLIFLLVKYASNATNEKLKKVFMRVDLKLGKIFFFIIIINWFIKF